MSFTNLLLSLLIYSSSEVIGAYEIDPKGYVVYCPCMGRFGNQVEQLLGSISFARALNRTLVLPPFIEYIRGQPKAKMVDYDEYFQVEPFKQESLRVILMRDFIQQIAPRIWPLNRRKVFCWSAHPSIYNKSLPSSCHAKEGNPFGPFWDYSGIDFIGDIYYGEEINEGFNLRNEKVIRKWIRTYPPSEYPVLAFSSAPAAFPSREEDQPLQKYLLWNPSIQQKAIQFINQHLKRPFIGIHLRNDVDWDNVCKHIGEEGQTSNLFASAQCTGYSGEFGKLTRQMCKPSLDTILNDVEYEARRIRAKSVFVASDREHYIDELNDKLGHLKVFARRRYPDDALISLAILSESDHFIGNCVSTFSSFVYRQRKYTSLDHRSQMNSTSFFGCRQNESRSERNEL